MSVVARPLAILLFLLAVRPAARAWDPAPALGNASEQSAEYVAAQDCSLAGYRAHLAQLQSLVSKCARHLGTKSCDWLRVGPDDNVSTAGGKRLVRYAWLRRVLVSAGPVIDGGNADKKLQQTTHSLEEASSRLAEEQTLSVQAPTVPDAIRNQAQVRRTLRAILATSEFERVKQPNFFERSWNLILRWLTDRLAGLAGYSRHSRWITHLFIAAALVTACALPIWWFIAQRRRQRLALWTSWGSGLDRLPSGGDWQRWLEEAQKLSQEGRWREAIHSTYWAAIALLESQGLWEQDRARTPREYLAVLRPEYKNRSPLAALTRSFERTWYGRDAAGQRQYEQARELFERLAS